MGLSHTVSEINGDLSRKSQIFPTPVYLTPPAEGVPWELSIGAGLKKARTMGYRAEKEVWRYPQPFRYNTQHTNAKDGRTDGQTDMLRQQRPHLRFALRRAGKNSSNTSY